MASDTSGGEAHRLHGMSVIFGAISKLWAFIIPLALVLFFGRGEAWEVWVGGVMLLGIIYETYHFFVFRYVFADRELILRQGLLFRNERHIPFARIQNVNLTQNILHRLFNVAAVQIETAGGSEPEATLKVLSMQAVEEMRRRIFDRGAVPVSTHSSTSATGDSPDQQPQFIGPLLRPADEPHAEAATEPAEAQGTELLRLPAGELVKLGLMSVRGFAAIAVFMGIAWQFELFDRIEEFAKQAVDMWEAQAGLDNVWLYAIVSVAGLGIFLALSILWSIVKFHDFRLVRNGDDLRFQCGMFTRISATVPRKRIQLVSVHETFVHRWFKRVSIRIETAGSGGITMDEQTRFSQRWLIPIVSRDRLGELLSELNDNINYDGIEWRRLAPGARRRMIKRGIIWALLLTLIMTAIFRPWGVLSILLFVPLNIWHAIAAERIARWARTNSGMAYRSGVLFRKTSMTLESKMQVVSTTSSPFDRRYEMASLAVDTAGAGTAEHKVDVRYLPYDVAVQLREELAAAAERSVWRI